MINHIKYDEQEFNNLYERLQNQKTNAFFCAVINDPILQKKIANDMCERFLNQSVQIIDFMDVESDFVFSSNSITSKLNEGIRILFFVNFQLAGGNLDDYDFLQTLNLSRDALAELPCVIVFMMPLYFRTMIARKAPDFNSFLQYRVDFISLEYSKMIEQETKSLPSGYSEAKKELLEYNLDRYNDLINHENLQAMIIIIKILELNDDVRTLHFAELSRFYNTFKRLLSVFENELEEYAFNIANVLYGQGDYADALEWYKKKLQSVEKLFGKEHLETSDIYSKIAWVYCQQRRYADSLEWHQKSLDTREKILTKDNIKIAETYCNMAWVYDYMGNYNKAMELYKNALVIFENKLGNDHQDTANVYHHIGTVYGKLSDYSKALEWFFKSLNIKIKVYGEKHPKVSDTYHNIGSLYINKGDTDNALIWYNKALLIDEKTLGKDHPSTSYSYYGIAFCYKLKGNYQEALDLFKKSFSIHEKGMGINHPDTIDACYNIISIYEKQKDFINMQVWQQKISN